MKKEYINPTMLVVNMKIDKCLLAGSETLPTGVTPTDPAISDSPEFGLELWDE